MSGGAVGSARRRLTKGQKEYLAKLRDPRWQLMKAKVLERDGYTCTWCGAGVDDGRNLQVHHGFYSKEFEGPWEYPDESLFTLCEKCHPAAENVRAQVLEALGKLHPRYHHHVYADIIGAIEELARGGSFDELEVPWAVNKNVG